MSYYEKNIECIKKYKAYMFSCMEKMELLSSSLSQLEDIYSVPTKDEQQAVIIKYNSAEIRLNSIYYPTKEAQKWVEQFKFQNLNIVISMFGFGNGIFARAIMEKMGKEDGLLIIEPCRDIFLHALEHYDLSDILSNRRVSIAVKGINEFEFHNTLQSAVNITNISSQIMCVYPQYDKIFPLDCIEFWKELQETHKHTKININTEIIFGKRFIDNTLENIMFLKDSNTLNELKEFMPKQVPAIVVAAGPSVSRNIDELKRAKGKAVIFAVDRILDYLLDEGVEPDFVVTVDPIKPIEYFTKRKNVEIPLICFLESNHEIFAAHAGRKVLCNGTRFLEQAYLNSQKTPPRMNSSASVATTAFTACISLGFERIVLVGQDLAYDGEFSHAGGIGENLGPIKDIMVEGIDGNMVRSRFDWKEFLIWYQDMVEIFPNIELIDAKDKGARIKGSINMPLSDVLDKYGIHEFNAYNMLENLEPTFNQEDLKSIREYLKDNIDVLSKIKEKSQEAIKLYQRLIKATQKRNTSTYADETIVKKLTKINTFISEQPIYSIMDYFIKATIAQHLAEMYKFSDDVQEDSKKTFEKSIYVFEAIVDAADYIKPNLEKAIENVV